ncbi:MAG: hypothetical protein ACOYLF_10620 [Blastocatellia bacterium]
MDFKLDFKGNEAGDIRVAKGRSGAGPFNGTGGRVDRNRLQGRAERVDEQTQ